MAQESFDCELVVLGDRELLAERARLLQLSVTLTDYRRGDQPRRHRPGELCVEHHGVATPSVPGRPDVRNAAHVLRLLDRGIDGCMSGEFSALVTAPVQKSLINDAGTPFSGHTEYLAARTGAARPVMLLTAGTMRIALATTHLPLREVSAAITEPSLVEALRVIDRDLRRWWGIAAPRIVVCGLNPHAGEAGKLGDEEIRVITPAIRAARALGVDASGPMPADTAFVPRKLAACDAVLAMYHDQGLPVIKHAGFGDAVNVTLGLPIVRTSVDHGTALDLAGTGRAEAGSLRAAIRVALEMTAART
jgi:4-hydroxythreonine-4-phosphate dehydrogenase